MLNEYWPLDGTSPLLLKEIIKMGEIQKLSNHIKTYDKWIQSGKFLLSDFLNEGDRICEDIAMEITMAIGTIKYPDVGLLEHLLSLENVDLVRISTWMHFETNVYPIYSKSACATLDKLGIPTPFEPNNAASYGLYVARLEGLKLHAPATGMPEIGLPRARVLQLGLERFK